jgi:hypothetical protein
VGPEILSSASIGEEEKDNHRHKKARRPRTLHFYLQKKFVDEVLESEVYDHDQVIDFDGTSIPRDAPGNYTLEKKGAKTVPIAATGSEKTNYTVALSCSLTGEKLRATLIWPGIGTRAKKQDLPDNLYLYYRVKSWMNTELLLKWVKDVLEKRTRKIKEGKKGLLIVDGVSFHHDPKVRNLISTELIFIIGENRC